MKRAEEMRAVFARFEESGLSLRAFGEREQVSYTTLQYWRRKLRAEDAERPRSTVSSAPELAPVRVVESSTSIDIRPARFEVWLVNGVSLEVPPGFDENDLRRLVGVLSAC